MATGPTEPLEHLELTEVLWLMPYASNATLLALDSDGARWIYKPVQGEQALWDFEHGSLAAREILTFEVSAAMGLHIVPQTVEADGPFGYGSAQRWVDEDLDFDPRPLFQPRLDPVLWPFAVLDIVTNNADRKVGHILRDGSTAALWAIDHGLTFHPVDKLRTVLWGFSGLSLPTEMIEALARLDIALDAGLCTRIEQLLSPVEAEILRHRVTSLRTHPIHPHPPDDRPAVPWPMW